MKETQSMWRADATNIESYRKYKSHLVVNDVTNEFKCYKSFEGIRPGILVGRIMYAIRQSLRVRGVNALFKMRRSLVNYEKQLTNEIRILDVELKKLKLKLSESSVYNEDRSATSVSVSWHMLVKEQYLITKVKLECKILERKRLRQQLKITADELLKEGK